MICFFKDDIKAIISTFIWIYGSTGHHQTSITNIFISALLLCMSFVCFMASYRIKGVDAGKVNAATQYSQSMDDFLKNIFNTENPVLTDLPEWGQRSPAGTEKPEESEVNYILLCFSSELRSSVLTVLVIIAF